MPDSFGSSIQTRVGFNYSAFIDGTGLTSAGLAANYMTVRNDTQSAATTTYPSTGAALPGTATGSPSGSPSAGANGTLPGNNTASTTTSSGGSGETGGVSGSSTGAGEGARVTAGLGSAVGAAVAGVFGMAVML